MFNWWHSRKRKTSRTLFINPVEDDSHEMKVLATVECEKVQWIGRVPLLMYREEIIKTLARVDEQTKDEIQDAVRQFFFSDFLSYHVNQTSSTVKCRKLFSGITFAFCGPAWIRKAGRKFLSLNERRSNDSWECILLPIISVSHLMSFSRADSWIVNAKFEEKDSWT